MTKNTEKNAEADEERYVSGRSAFFPILIGFVVGAVSGAAAALLVAPRSGRDTRAQLGGAYRRAILGAARIPPALKSAERAARTAFTEARAEEVEAGEKDVTAPVPALAH
jgi:hypothetical protein